MNNFATANNQTAARSVGRVVPTQARRGVTSQETAMHRRLGSPWVGESGCGTAGWARRCTAGRGNASQARLGIAGAGNASQARQGSASNGSLRQRRRGEARRSEEPLGEATQEWRGKSGPREDGLGEATQEWPCKAAQVEDWSGKATQAGRGVALHRAARRGITRHKPGDATGVKIAFNFPTHKHQ
jgi:hypothetical protein